MEEQITQTSAESNATIWGVTVSPQINFMEPDGFLFVFNDIDVLVAYGTVNVVQI